MESFVHSYIFFILFFDKNSFFYKDKKKNGDKKQKEAKISFFCRSKKNPVVKWGSASEDIIFGWKINLP
jgi:hypothetical protein